MQSSGPTHPAPIPFLGQRVRDRQVGGLTLTEYRYAPHQVMAPHAHRLAYFYLVLGGGYEERFGHRWWERRERMLVFHPEGEVHADRFGRAGGRLFSIETDHAWIARAREHGPVLDRPDVLDASPAQPLASRLYYEFTAPDSAAGLAIEGLTLEILSFARRATPAAQRPPAWLHQAEEYLRVHFREPVGLDALATAVGVHPSHLARTF